MQEQQLKDKFRQFWMSAIADGFKDNLEEIRKVWVAMIYLWDSNYLTHIYFPFQEPNLGSSRLAILIDSLVAGAEVYNDTTINEMDVVLN